MKIGYIGLGKMGSNMVERLLEKGHDVFVYNRSPEPANEIAKKGATATKTVEDLVASLDTPRTIWIMVSWQAVDAVLDTLIPLLNEGDTIIDGGNSPYKETVKRAERLKESGINFMDAGVSGGPSGARNGACIMVGGEKDVVENYRDLFEDLSLENGFGHVGKTGAGHFVKMVHNGIEYGMMQAIGEGFEVMKKSNFDLDLKKVSQIYTNGSVIESRLIDWLNLAYEKFGVDLDQISGEIAHSGEGRWTVEAARDLGVDVGVIEKSLQFRVDSKGNPSYTGQVVSALRGEFGGHSVGKDDEGKK
jgi:6-phosphogluconate dehydrogenase